MTGPVASNEATEDKTRRSGTDRSPKTEFWKHRRPKHLFTGLVHCGECGGSLAAVGKDYLACTAARSGVGCSNRKGVRRNPLELVVLEGLETQLMAPELVEEFIRAFHDELNRQNLANELQKAHHQTELSRTTRRLKGLYDAIADGLRSPGLNEQLLELEARQTELSRLVQSAPAPAPRFHPKLAQVYRATVADLHAALDNPEARTEAAEFLRGLVERITVRADAQGHSLEITGDIVKLLALPGDTVPSSFESSVKVVAGVGFEPTTFRL